MLLPETLADWVALISVLIGVVFGGGGIGAFLKLRHDRRNGVRQENRADSDSFNAQAVAMLEAQFNYLVTPLQREIDTLRDKQKLTDASLEAMDIELRKYRSIYWSAIEHIRTMYAWITRHMPTDLQETTEIPKPPETLAPDIYGSPPAR